MWTDFSTLIGSCATHQCIVAKGTATLPSKAQHASCWLCMAAKLIDHTKRIPCLHRSKTVSGAWQGCVSFRIQHSSLLDAHPPKKVDEEMGLAEHTPFSLEYDAKCRTTLLLFSIRRASFSRCSTFSAS